MSMYIKAGVKLCGLTPQAALGAMVAYSGWHEVLRDDQPFVLTSVTDGLHGKASLHYQGNAFDIRIVDPAGKWALSTGAQQQVVGEMRRRLSGEFDVILESNHIHIEWQPKAT